MSIWIDIN